MKSVNVLLTETMLEKIDAINPDSRSEAVRRTLAAILSARDDGVAAPLQAMITYARATSSRVRRQNAGMDVGWKKSIIWIPEELHDVLDELAVDHETMEDRIRVADLIRGAIIYISGAAPYAADPA